MLRKSKNKTIGIILLCLCLLLLTGCTQQKKLLCNPQPFDAYPTVLSEFLPEYKAEINHTSNYHALSTGSIQQCFDVQAETAIQSGIDAYWYPQYLSTVVIAVDRNQTDVIIDGWEDLRTIPEPIGISDQSMTLRLLIASIAYGLEGENFSIEPALTLLEEIHQADRLHINTYHQPVLICFDFQAAALAAQGKNMQIIVPEEGTLSFQTGILSAQPLQFEPEIKDALLTAGLRLCTGESRNPIYPSADSYASAVQPKHFEHLLHVTQEIAREFNRNVIHIRLYTAVEERELVVMALLVILLDICWMVTAMHRTMRRDVWHVLFLGGTIIAAWVLLRLYQLQLPYQGILSRLYWYAFFVLQICLPLTMLWLALIVDQPENNRILHRQIKYTVVLCLLLLLLVMTNDLHHLLFQSDGYGNWIEDQNYGILYYAIFLVDAALTVFAMITLIRKNWNSPRKLGWLLSMAFCLAILLYAVGYVMDRPVAKESDFAITNSFFSLLFFESALRSGLVPVNTRYRKLFSASPLNMQLVDEVGKTVLASANSIPLPAPLWNRLRRQPGIPILKDENTIVYANCISGGMVIWQEDIHQLENQKREYRNSIKQLHLFNAQLMKQTERKRRQLEQCIRNELFSSLEKDSREKTVMLSQMIHIMHRDDENQQLHAARAVLLLCHIKRRCNLFFLSREGDTISADELTMYINELAEFGGYASVQALLNCTIHTELNIQHAKLFYDFAYALLDWAARTQCSTLLGNLEQSGDRIYSKILPAEACTEPIFSNAMLQAIEQECGMITYKELDDTTAIWLSFPAGGESHA